MNWETYLEIMHCVEKLKNQTRHSYTSAGRHESVAEHSWRLCVMAYFLKDKYPEADMDKVILMCLLHDIGEIFTGDIPSFEKKQSDERIEEQYINAWITGLPQPYCIELADLFQEMRKQTSLEAKLSAALDKMEAVIQHDESDIRTWIPLEYELQKTYGAKEVSFSEKMKALKQAVDKETKAKIEQAKTAGYVTEPFADIETQSEMGVIRLVLGDCFTNCYLVFHQETKEAIIIDPADDADSIIKAVKAEQLQVRYIFITHGHTDHVLALAEIKEAFHAPVVVSKIDAWRLMDEALMNERPYVQKRYTAVRPDILLGDGDCLYLATLQFATKLLPGHTEGSMALVGENAAFTGDVILIQGHGKTSLPGGNEEDMQKSLAYIQQNWKGYTIYPGHKEQFVI